jgi:hypothetical protein
MPHIRALRRLPETTARTGGTGDNWHSTWTADDRQLVALCDGSAWPEVRGHTGLYYNTRPFFLDGPPNDPRFTHLPGFPDLLCEDEVKVNRYYGFGLLAVGERIYHYLSTPNRPFFPEPGARFVGAKLIWSPDSGQTWRNQDGSTPVRWEPWEQRSRANLIFFEEPDEAFALITCLQMGQAYGANRDGFAYLYAPGGNAEGAMNQIVLARAPLDQMLDRASYRFYAGDGAWSADVADRQPVLTCPAGWVNTRIHPYSWHPSVVWYPATGEYLMANWGMATAADGMWFAAPSYLGFWTAPQPWGPWTQVHEETAWLPTGDPQARAYQPQIPARWLAADGQSFELVFTEFRDGLYCYNHQRVEVTLG